MAEAAVAARRGGRGVGGARLAHPVVTTHASILAPGTSLQVPVRLAAALRIALVGPGAGHALSDERLPGSVRHSIWYLTGFLIPSGTPPEKGGDADEDDVCALPPAMLPVIGIPNSIHQQNVPCTRVPGA